MLSDRHADLYRKVKSKPPEACWCRCRGRLAFPSRRDRSALITPHIGVNAESSRAIAGVFLGVVKTGMTMVSDATILTAGMCDNGRTGNGSTNSDIFGAVRKSWIGRQCATAH